jgi:hypothetical protein
MRVVRIEVPAGVSCGSRAHSDEVAYYLDIAPISGGIADGATSNLKKPTAT